MKLTERQTADLKLLAAARQQQFLEVISRDEALARFQGALLLSPVGVESVALAQALGRVLASDVVADIDVPGFDRSNVDGFAVQAVDTYGASDNDPKVLRLNAELIEPGTVPRETVPRGTGTAIATGGMLPRGADAVVMIEDTELLEDGPQPRLEVRRTVAPGQYVTFAGTDLARGETALRTGQLLSSREIGVLAAIGRDVVEVYRRPRVAIISTGNELVPPGGPIRAAGVYDSNAAIIGAAVRELGGEPVMLGISADDEKTLEALLDSGLEYDMIILSGGTSKGSGDLSYRVVSRLRHPGIVAHGVALKPGKPICLAVTGKKPVVILPGFPTSAIFTFHEFVAPVLRAFAGLPAAQRRTVQATLPVKVNSQRGRTEYVMVGLVRADEGLRAYPMGKGSGAVTAFSFADGFFAVPAQTEIVQAGSVVDVQIIGQRLEPADLVFIGSHCVGLDHLLSRLQGTGVSVKALFVGSMGGLAAAKRGECDVAGIHLLDPATGQYNHPFITPALDLAVGYRRMQGLVFRPDDTRFAGKTLEAALAAALAEADCVMVNRNPGSGTRILIDKLLAQRQPPGYAVQVKSHNAVAAAVSQRRADWGVAIDTVARRYGLGFIAMQEEHYDFVLPRARQQRPPVRRFLELLADPRVQAELRALGFRL